MASVFKRCSMISFPWKLVCESRNSHSKVSCRFSFSASTSNNCLRLILGSYFLILASTFVLYLSANENTILRTFRYESPSLSKFPGCINTPAVLPHLQIRRMSYVKTSFFFVPLNWRRINQNGFVSNIYGAHGLECLQCKGRRIWINLADFGVCDLMKVEPLHQCLLREKE
jgi:hypothetical protein